MSTGGYTADELAVYMRDALAATAYVLGLSDLLTYRNAVTEVGLVLGLPAPWTDSPRLRALARREAWRLAMAQAAGDYSYSADGASYNRQQVYDHAAAMYALAADEARDLAPDSSGGAGGGGGGSGRIAATARVESIW